MDTLGGVVRALSRTEHKMSPKPALAVSRSGIDVALCELIAAVDRRVPHVERAGEVRVATIAAALRTEAVCRLAELRRAERDPLMPDEALGDAIMTDDGGPALTELQQPPGPLGSGAGTTPES